MTTEVTLRGDVLLIQRHVNGNRVNLASVPFSDEVTPRDLLRGAGMRATLTGDAPLALGIAALLDAE